MRINAPKRTCVAAALAALTGGAALAQTSPYYLGAALGYTHDSNVHRLSDTSATDPTAVQVFSAEIESLCLAYA